MDTGTSFFPTTYITCPFSLFLNSLLGFWYWLFPSISSPHSNTPDQHVPHSISTVCPATIYYLGASTFLLPPEFPQPSVTQPNFPSAKMGNILTKYRKSLITLMGYILFSLTSLTYLQGPHRDKNFRGYIPVINLIIQTIYPDSDFLGTHFLSLILFISQVVCLIC